VLAFGCVDEKRGGGNESGEPSIPSLPSETPAGECVKTVDACCKESACLSFPIVDCESMGEPRYYCDAHCKPKFECVEPVACTMDARICPDGSAVGRVAPDCEFAPCPSVTPKITSESVIQVTLHLWSSGICSERGPNGEVRFAERDYVAFNNATVFFKHSCEANSTTKNISRSELESLAEKILRLNTPVLIAQNASEQMCVGGSGTLSLVLDGKTLSFRDACGRSTAYREAYDAATNQLTNYFS